jgi:hypothetical protein
VAFFIVSPVPEPKKCGARSWSSGPDGNIFLVRQVVGWRFALDLSVRLVADQRPVCNAVHYCTLFHAVVSKVVARKDMMVLEILELNALTATPVARPAKGQKAKPAAVHGASLAGPDSFLWKGTRAESLCVHRFTVVRMNAAVRHLGDTIKGD